MNEIKTVTTRTGGGGPAEPTAERHPQCDPGEKLTKEVLVPSDWTTKNIRVKAEPVASATLGLRLAFSCSTRGKRAYVLTCFQHSALRSLTQTPPLALATKNAVLLVARSTLHKASLVPWLCSAWHSPWRKSCYP